MHDSAEPELVGRLAPSPTGALHLGNARSFLLAWLSVRSRDGVLLCRIDDIDGPRTKEGAAEQALEDLQWLGLDWDAEPILQSQRAERHSVALQHLIDRGLAYPCVCTRSEIERAQSAPQEAADHGTPYPGTCRDRFRDAEHARAETGRDAAWRLRVEPGRVVEFEDAIHGRVAIDVSADCGDFVVAKRDGQPAYQLASIVDDADFGVSEVLRGDDLLSSTPRQILIAEALGTIRLPRWVHVPLIVGSDGRRLAKRHGDTRIAWYRRRGISGEEIVGWLAQSCGLRQSAEPISVQELAQDFAIERVGKDACVLAEDPWKG